MLEREVSLDRFQFICYLSYLSYLALFHQRIELTTALSPVSTILMNASRSSDKASLGGAYP